MRECRAAHAEWLARHAFNPSLFAPITEPTFTGILAGGLAAATDASNAVAEAIVHPWRETFALASLPLQFACAIAKPIDLLLGFGDPGSAPSEWKLIGVEVKHPKSSPHTVYLYEDQWRSCDAQKKPIPDPGEPFWTDGSSTWKQWQLDAAVCQTGWMPEALRATPLSGGVFLDARGRTPAEAYHHYAKERGQGRGEEKPLLFPDYWRGTGYSAFAAALRDWHDKHCTPSRAPRTCLEPELLGVLSSLWEVASLG